MRGRGFVLTLLLGLIVLAAPLPGAAESLRRWPDGFDAAAAPPAVTRAAPVPSSTAAAVAAGGPGEKPGALYYTVRPGDTLWLISVRYGVPIRVVAETNGFNGNKVLREGMQIYLPYSNEIGTAAYGSDGLVVKGRGLHFVASISRQQCWFFRDGKLLNQWTCSTGRPSSPSIPGNYTVQTKLPRAYSAAADFWMPAWLGIYDAGTFENGIHGIPYRASNGERLWTDLVGTPITYGCIMLSDDLAQKLYEMAYIGMPVTVLP